MAGFYKIARAEIILPEQSVGADIKLFGDFGNRIAVLHRISDNFIAPHGRNFRAGQIRAKQSIAAAGEELVISVVRGAAQCFYIALHA